MKRFTVIISLSVLILTLCMSAHAEIQTITVSNAREFLGALGSNRVIEMAPGEYNLSGVDMPKLAEGVTWSRAHDGPELVLTGIKNLTIRGANPNSKPRIVINPRYAFVMKFANCSDIAIENVWGGHSEGGYCEGGVFSFENSSNITIIGTSMYGCGTEGLQLSNVSGMKVTNSEIYKCTYYIMTVSGGENIVFENCTFRDNEQFTLVNVDGTANMSFENCTFINNRGQMFNVTGTAISVSNSAFSGNSDANIQGSNNVEFINSSFGADSREPASVNAGRLEQRQRIVGTTELRFTPESSGLWVFRTVDRDDSDPLLRVYNTDRELIGVDDDSGGDLNALLIVSLVGGREYIISAGFYGNEGQYYLETKELSAVELLGDRTAVSGVTIFSFTPLISGSWELFTADNGDTDPVLLLFDSNGKLIASDDDSAGDLNARIIASLAKGETYYILATFYGDRTADYTLHVVEPAATSPAGVPVLDSGVAAAMSDEDFRKLCANGTPEDVKSAIEAGANVNAAGEYGETALHSAVFLNGPDVVRVLLENGANVNAANKFDVSVLHYAVQWTDNPEVVRVLIENGADVNARDDEGKTPLFSAVALQNPKFILLLLDGGAYAGIPDNHGRTAVDFLPDSTPDGVDEAEWQTVVERLKSARHSFTAEPDAGVKGLWLRSPDFPKNAALIEFRNSPHWNGVEELSDVSYIRSLDGLLTFKILRHEVAESELQGPDDVEGLVEMRVWNDHVDESVMEFNWSTVRINTAPTYLPQFSAYPHATAEYQLGANEDTRKYVALYIFPGAYRFDVEVTVPVDWAEDYVEQIGAWLYGLEFVEN